MPIWTGPPEQPQPQPGVAWPTWPPAVPPDAAALIDALPRRRMPTLFLLLLALICVASPALTWIAPQGELIGGAPVLVGQFALGAACYLALRTALIGSLRRQVGCPLIVPTPDGRIRLELGHERINLGYPRLLANPSLVARDVTLALVAGAVLMAGTTGLGVAAAAICGDATALFTGSACLLGCELLQLLRRVRAVQREHPRDLLDSNVIGAVMAAWVVTSGLPYPPDGVPVVRLRENLRQRPQLADAVRYRIHRDVSAQRWAEAVAVGGMLTGWLT